jgi:putative transcriptional regulator
MPGQGRSKIKLTVAETAYKKGVIVDRGPHKGKVSLTQLMQGTGAAYTTMFPMLRHPEQCKGISFDLLERLCAFLQCQPGDLIKFVPDATTEEYKLPERQYRPEGENEAISGW